MNPVRENDTGLPYTVPPFRIGTTSYIYPADVLPNVEKLVRRVDDIEIVLFEVTPFSPLPDARTLERLRELGRANDATYTVHLPLELALASVDAETREASINLAHRTMRAARSLDPWGYIIHVDHDGGWPGSWVQWRRLSKESLRRLMDSVEEPERLCVENIESLPPDEVFGLADELGLGVCLDVGHLFKVGVDPVPYLDGRLSSSRVVHLHGWDGERDHRSLQVMRPEAIEPVIQRLHRLPYGGVVTLEVFSEEALLSSWECLARSTGAESQGPQEDFSSRD
jgi:sugar phosphate isomerase/epimerase